MMDIDDIGKNSKAKKTMKILVAVLAAVAWIFWFVGYSTYSSEKYQLDALTDGYDSAIDTVRKCEKDEDCDMPGCSAKADVHLEFFFPGSTPDSVAFDVPNKAGFRIFTNSYISTDEYVKHNKQDVYFVSEQDLGEYVVVKDEVRYTEVVQTGYTEKYYTEFTGNYCYEHRYEVPDILKQELTDWYSRDPIFLFCVAYYPYYLLVVTSFLVLLTYLLVVLPWEIKKCKAISNGTVIYGEYRAEDRIQECKKFILTFSVVLAIMLVALILVNSFVNKIALKNGLATGAAFGLATAIGVLIWQSLNLLMYTLRRRACRNLNK